MIIAFLPALLCAPQVEPRVEAAQFATMMRSSHSSIRDIAFIYEGDMTWTGPVADLLRPTQEFDEKFQGVYINRADDSMFIDVYYKNMNENAQIIRSKRSLLKNVVAVASIAPDAIPSRQGLKARRGPGGAGALNGPQSPHMLYYGWIINAMYDPQPWGYEFRGWDEIDGRRCLTVKTNIGPSGGVDNLNYHLYSFDIERGGHPLKVETFRNAKLSTRLDKVSLQQFTARDGVAVWIPVAGTVEGFEWENKFYSRPVLRQTIALVAGSVVVNQGLPDAVFSIDRKGGMPGSDELKKLEKINAESTLGRNFGKDVAGPKQPAFRTDPEGVQQRLNEQLAKADDQARQLKASSVARSGWITSMLPQIALSSVGIGALILALWLRRRA